MSTRSSSADFHAAILSRKIRKSIKELFPRTYHLELRGAALLHEELSYHAIAQGEFLTVDGVKALFNAYQKTQSAWDGFRKSHEHDTSVSTPSELLADLAGKLGLEGCKNFRGFELSYGLIADDRNIPVAITAQIAPGSTTAQWLEGTEEEYSPRNLREEAESFKAAAHVEMKAGSAGTARRLYLSAERRLVLANLIFRQQKRGSGGGS